MSLDAHLVTALRALGPYLPEAVVAGGWVPHIYAEQIELAEHAGLLTTRDLDIAVPRTIAQRENSIDHLLEEAGFDCEFRSRDNPPVTAYVANLGQPDEMEIEFITPMERGEETAISVLCSRPSYRLKDRMLEQRDGDHVRHQSRWHSPPTDTFRRTDWRSAADLPDSLRNGASTQAKSMLTRKRGVYLCRKSVSGGQEASAAGVSSLIRDGSASSSLARMALWAAVSSVR